MIGYLSGKVLEAADDNVLVDVSGVGYSVNAPSRLVASLSPGADLRLWIHTHLRENALELFGFPSRWEQEVFLALISVSGVGPRTAITMLGGLEPESLLSAIVREDRASLTSVSGVGKKTAERFIVELGEKARKLLAERGVATRAAATSGGATATSQGRGAGATSGAASADPAELWNDALAALVNLGYREADALAAIKLASNRATETGAPTTLEGLVRTSLQLMSRGMTT